MFSLLLCIQITVTVAGLHAYADVVAKSGDVEAACDKLIKLLWREAMTATTVIATAAILVLPRQGHAVALHVGVVDWGPVCGDRVHVEHPMRIRDRKMLMQKS